MPKVDRKRWLRIKLHANRRRNACPSLRAYIGTLPSARSPSPHSPVPATWKLAPASARRYAVKSLVSTSASASRY